MLTSNFKDYCTSIEEYKKLLARNIYYVSEEGFNEAKNQNPEIKVMYEFPKEEAKIKFTDWLDKNSKYQKTIDEIRVRPEK